MREGASGARLRGKNVPQVGDGGGEGVERARFQRAAAQVLQNTASIGAAHALSASSAYATVRSKPQVTSRRTRR